MKVNLNPLLELSNNNSFSFLYRDRWSCSKVVIVFCAVNKGKKTHNGLLWLLAFDLLLCLQAHTVMCRFQIDCFEKKCYYILWENYLWTFLCSLFSLALQLHQRHMAHMYVSWSSHSWKKERMWGCNFRFYTSLNICWQTELLNCKYWYR